MYVPLFFGGADNYANKKYVGVFLFGIIRIQMILFYPIKQMEKGYTPEQPVQSDFLFKLHQLIRDGQNGLFSFEEVRANARSLAVSVLEQSEEGRKLLPFNILLSSPEQ